MQARENDHPLPPSARARCCLFPHFPTRAGAGKSNFRASAVRKRARKAPQGLEREVFKSPIVAASKGKKKARCERRRQERGETKKKLDLLLLVEKKNSSSYPRRRLPEQASLEPSRKVREPRSIVIGLVGLLGVEAGVAVCVLSGSERRENEV